MLRKSIAYYSEGEALQGKAAALIALKSGEQLWN